MRVCILGLNELVVNVDLKVHMHSILWDIHVHVHASLSLCLCLTLAHIQIQSSIQVWSCFLFPFSILGHCHPLTLV